MLLRVPPEKTDTLVMELEVSVFILTLVLQVDPWKSEMRKIVNVKSKCHNALHFWSLYTSALKGILAVKTFKVEKRLSRSTEE